jgi:hypothetical protein
MGRWARVSALGLLAGLMTLVAGPGTAAESPDPAPFRLISGERPGSLERKLQAAGTQGYHLIAAARGTTLNGKGRGVALLGRDPENATPTEFALITSSGDLASAADDAEFKQLTAAGYRLRMRGVLPDNPDDWWVPEAGYESQVWLILERRGNGGPYTYAAFGYSTEAEFKKDMAAYVDEGYAVLGILNSARRLRILLERDLSKNEKAPQIVAPDGRHRLLMGSRKLGVRMQLNDVAAKGYRLAGVADASTIAPPFVLVEKRATRIEDHVYRTLYEPGTKIYKDKLDRKLNKRARKGLRIVPGGITSTVVVFERSEQAVEYRTLSSRTRPGLPEQLASAVDRGFRVMALFVGGDETTVVTERDAPAR